jgi:nucleoside-diphosphate-sugar epimerase
MRVTATIGDFLEGLSGGRIKPLISRQVLATIGSEVTLDTTKAREQLGYRPVITREQGMSEPKAQHLEASVRSRSDVN